MNKKKINFCYLYPDSFNLHGDRGNILAFERTAKLMDIDLNLKRMEAFAEPIDFNAFDILFVSPGELRTCEGAAKILVNQADGFKNFIDCGKTMIVIGTSIALFAKKTIRTDDSVFYGLGLVDAVCKERSIVYSNDEIFTIDYFDKSFKMTGGQIQMIDIDLNGETALGTVSYGYGNCHQKDEGIIKNNFFFTNMLGPVFIKNPWFAAQILIDVLKFNDVTDQFKIPEFELEHRSNEAIHEFIDLKIKKYDKSRLE